MLFTQFAIVAQYLIPTIEGFILSVVVSNALQFGLRWFLIVSFRARHRQATRFRRHFSAGNLPGLPATSGKQGRKTQKHVKPKASDFKSFRQGNNRITSTGFVASVRAPRRRSVIDIRREAFESASVLLHAEHAGEFVLFVLGACVSTVVLLLRDDLAGGPAAATVGRQVAKLALALPMEFFVSAVMMALAEKHGIPAVSLHVKPLNRREVIRGVLWAVFVCNIIIAAHALVVPAVRAALGL